MFSNSESKAASQAALTAAKQAIELTGTRWIAGDVHCAFIEPDPERYKNLEQKIGSFDKPAMIVTHAYPETFTRGLSRSRKIYRNPLAVSTYCLFLSILSARQASPSQLSPSFLRAHALRF